MLGLANGEKSSPATSTPRHFFSAHASIKTSVLSEFVRFCPRILHKHREMSPLSIFPLIKEGGLNLPESPPRQLGQSVLSDA
jgi:hypothetical protein